MLLIYTSGLVSGIASHALFFHRGEHHLYGVSYVLTFFALWVNSVAALVYLASWSFPTAALAASRFNSSFLAGVYLSLCLYRTIFSPLRDFPGPFWVRFSDLFFSVRCYKQDAFRQISESHEQYGEFVRIGSNSLSITNPKAVQAIYGYGSKCQKSGWYDLTRPLESMQTTRSASLHDARRRTWSTAFGEKALQGYEERIKPIQDQLVDHIKSFGAQSFDVVKSFNLYSFDVMGDLAFGNSFDMLQSSEEHWAIKLFYEGLLPLAFLPPVWLFRVLMAIPGLSKDWWKFVMYCRERCEERMKKAPVVPDVMSALLKAHEGGHVTKEDMQWLHGDSQLIIVAGSDSTYSVLSYILYELARHPQHLPLLRDEIFCDRSRTSVAPTNQYLQHLPHLNSIIHETMRLYPPVPTTLPRLVPPEGLVIDGNFVPGDTVVWCPQYAIGRSERIYINASSFIPERWTTRPELVKQQGAFAPFSTGPYGCIGRPLAMLNLRTTLARLLLEFDFQLAPDARGPDLIESGATEHFTLAPGPLLVKFSPRKTS